MYPVGKQLLLYMHDENALHPWAFGVQLSKTQVGLSEELFGAKATEDILLSYGTKGVNIIYKTITGRIMASYRSNKVQIAVAVADTSAKLSEVMFTEYNVVAAFGQGFVYAGKTEWASNKLWVLSHRFDAAAMNQQLIAANAEKDIARKMKEKYSYWQQVANRNYNTTQGQKPVFNRKQRRANRDKLISLPWTLSHEGDFDYTSPDFSKR
jgi:hypothetical protein